MKHALLLAVLLYAFRGLLGAQETTVLYEGFDYLKGGVLAGGATGSGWIGIWGDAGEGGNLQSELIIGPGSFPVIPGAPAASGQHVDLNGVTGDRRITRHIASPLAGGSPLTETVFSFVLDFGPGAGVDYAGIELSNSAGGPVVFLGKPAGAGPGSPGSIGIDVYGQGFVGTGVGGSGQKLLQLRWNPNSSGPEAMTLLVRDAATGQLLGSATQSAEISFNQVTLLARRDLGAGGAIPAFDEIRATVAPVPTYTLGVVSTNPSSGVAITISPADANGAGNGDTPIDLHYTYGASVALTAPATAGGNNFVKWTLSGADYSTRQSITVAMTENRSLVAVYQVPPPVIYSLSVAASGAGGPVAIAVSPVDQAGQGDGFTSFNRNYVSGTVVYLAAPPTLSGYTFDRWTIGGTTLSSSASVSVTMTAAISLTAVYVANPLTLSVTSTGPSAGVSIAVTPADINNATAGTTSFSRIYPSGSSVTLTAPILPGMNFRKWQRGGLDYQNSRTVTTTLDSNQVLNAVYDYQFDEKVSGVSFEGNNIHLTWTSLGGRTYVVEASAELTDGFHAISGPLQAAGEGPTVSDFVEIFQTRPSKRFYRIKVLAP